MKMRILFLFLGVERDRVSLWCSLLVLELTVYVDHAGL